MHSSVGSKDGKGNGTQCARLLFSVPLRTSALLSLESQLTDLCKGLVEVSVSQTHFQLFDSSLSSLSKQLLITRLFVGGLGDKEMVRNTHCTFSGSVNSYFHHCDGINDLKEGGLFQLTVQKILSVTVEEA